MSRGSWYVLVASLILLGCNREPAAPPAAAPAALPGPRVLAPQTESDLGEVDFAKPYAHAFKIRNVGDQPLQLAVARKSCACTDVEVTPAELAPGQEGAVTLRWVPAPGQNGPHTVAAELTTNDAKQPLLRLEMRGRVNPVIRVWPEDWYDVDFKQIQPGRSEERELKVFSTKLDDFALEVRASHPGLEVTTTRLPPETPVGDVTARCAYLVTLKTSDKLPRGYFRETLTLDVKGPEARQLTLPISGSVETGALQVAPSEVEFKQPQLARGDSQKVQVRFVVPSDNERVEVARLEPPFLTADPPTPIKKGLWQLTVRIPPDHPEAKKLQADGFFEGRLVLRTSAASAPEVPVRVRWRAGE